MCSEVIPLQRPRLPKVKMVCLNSKRNPDRRLYMGYIGFKENSSASSMYAKRLWGFGGFVCLFHVWCCFLLVWGFFSSTHKLLGVVFGTFCLDFL